MINNISNTFCICTEPSVITPDGLTGAKYAEVLNYLSTLQLGANRGGHTVIISARCSFDTLRHFNKYVRNRLVTLFWDPY